MNSNAQVIDSSKLTSLEERRGFKRMQLHENAMLAAENYRRCEAELFNLISEIDEKQIYFDLEIPTLHQYCVEMLKLSPQVTYDFMSVIRKSREVPALKEAIQNKQTTLSKLRKICSVINEQNAKEWIGLTVECSSRIVERAVAMANPRSAIVERMSYVSGDTLQFQLAVSVTWSDQLSRLKDVLSQKEMRAVSSEEALFFAMTEYLRKHDPVQKAARAKKRVERPSSQEIQTLETAQISVGTDDVASESQNQKQNCPGVNISKAIQKSSRTIPARILHKVNLRDQNRCSVVDRHGVRCKETRWLQKHHIEHFADGGAHTTENLQTLCWGHHCMQHRR